MNLILDLLLVGILAMGVFLGIKKGFVKAVEKPLKPLLAVLFASTFSRAFAVWAVEPIIGVPIFNQIRDFLCDKCINAGLDGSSNEFPTLIKAIAALVGIDLQSVDGSSSDALAALSEKLATPIVNIVTAVISFVVLLILGRLLLALLFAVVNKAMNFGALQVVNRILGVIVCVFFSIFMVWGAVLLFDFLISIPYIAETEAIQNFTGGIIYKLFKQFSPLELLFSF